MTLDKLDKLITEALQKPTKSCNCGCGGSCSNKGPLLMEGKVKHLLSEGLQYHIDNKVPLFETIYRYGSEKHLSLIKEARRLYSRGVIDVIEEDKDILATNLGEIVMLEGREVALDLPMVNEEYKITDLLDIKSKLKNKGFNVKVGYPTKNDPKLQIQASMEDVENGLESVLNQMFGDDYRIVFDTNQRMFEAKKKTSTKKDPPIGKPKRGGSKAYYVYVRDPKTKKVKKVSFGSGGLRAKINNPKARKAFAARHKCSQKNDRTKPSYWSCRLPRYAKTLGLGNNKNTFW